MSLIDDFMNNRSRRDRRALAELPHKLRATPSANRAALRLAAQSEWLTRADLTAAAEKKADAGRGRAWVELVRAVERDHLDIVGRELTWGQIAILEPLADEFALGVMSPQEAFDAVFDI